MRGTELLQLLQDKDKGSRVFHLNLWIQQGYHYRISIYSRPCRTDRNNDSLNAAGLLRATVVLSTNFRLLRHPDQQAEHSNPSRSNELPLDFCLSIVPSSPSF